MRYILNIRDDAPDQEVRNALVNFGRGHNISNTVNSDGNIILWSATGWNCGTGHTRTGGLR
jgi:hypothetical protein